MDHVLDFDLRILGKSLTTRFFSNSQIFLKKEWGFDAVFSKDTQMKSSIVQ